MNALPHEMCHVWVCWLGWESLTHLGPSPPVTMTTFTVVNRWIVQRRILCCLAFSLVL